MVTAMQITLESRHARDGFMGVGRLSGWANRVPATDETAYEQYAESMAGENRETPIVGVKDWPWVLTLLASLGGALPKQNGLCR